MRTQTVQINWRDVYQAICMGQTTYNLPPLLEPRFTGMSPLALGLEGYGGEDSRGDRVLPPGLVLQDAVAAVAVMFQALFRR